MQTDHVRTQGYDVAWSLGGAPDHRAVLEAFERAGYGKDAPNPRTPTGALRAAVDVVFPGTVKGCGEGQYGTIVTKPNPSELELNPRQEVKAWCKVDRTTGDVEIGCDQADMSERLVEEWREQMKKVDTAAVNTALRDVLRGLGCIPDFDPNEFFVPGWAMSIVEPLVEGIVVASGGKCRKKTLALDTNTCAAVLDQFEAAVDRKCAEIRHRISQNTLGSKGLQNRAQETREMEELMEKYEEMLGGKLDKCRANLTSTRSDCVRAAMSSSEDDVVDALDYI
jgi:hypothetical protein